MILLDTSVIAETQRKVPDDAAMDWLNAQDPTNLYLSAITAAELTFGVQAVPDGKRRDGLIRAVTAILEEDFSGRILPFDGTAARIYGTQVAVAHQKGYTISIADGQIAAIALSRPGAVVATRNPMPFMALGADVLDPWAFGGPRRR
ncbi:type II toxin-antitoxin system VapC family toxin [Limimaricola sp. G21655-S1]|uniref:type II toxin-antitoxin system VapC family toxin n=1 Tax=Limimaricola sp. G21655-S1 TaxID=3014768 RepID=UPI0022AEAD69|nr:type II toxin-antitoxin system VapC family toxin [Limimaricola sp. G21655-S1]MCZ4262976.1 type II toxin-antitoxin system VapC family toxin [Limimaricola sp. G21655-S1]